ncbi:hypothetical protein MRX96_025219 [Rhipicephalus microplus]
MFMHEDRLGSSVMKCGMDQEVQQRCGLTRSQMGRRLSGRRRTPRSVRQMESSASSVNRFAPRTAGPKTTCPWFGAERRESDNFEDFHWAGRFMRV